MRGDAVKTKTLQNLLCALMAAVFAAQQTGMAEEPVSAGTQAQTVFAYQSSAGARAHEALFGPSLLPVDLPVELVPVDPSALEHATLNSTVTFRIVRDVAGGYGSGGTLIEAKVIRIREGKLRVRRGILEPRVVEVTVPGLMESSPPPGFLKLRLESSQRSSSSRGAMKLVTFPMTAIRIFVVIPAEWVYLVVLCGITRCEI
jgi:hypothetical protein